MNVLAIETATELAGVAVVDASGARAGGWATGRRRHAETLVPTITFVLQQASVAVTSLDAVAVDIGPGLFTGLRVGVATASGLAQGLGIGVVGVGSLAVLGRAAVDAGHSGPVVAMVDTRRGEVFTARYRAADDGSVIELDPPRAVTPEALARELDEAPTKRGESTLAVGDGALRYAALFGGANGVVLAGPSLAMPSPDVLLTMALEQLSAGVAPQPPGSVLPSYLRGPDVRINWQRRDGTPRPAPLAPAPRT